MQGSCKVLPPSFCCKALVQKFTADVRKSHRACARFLTELGQVPRQPYNTCLNKFIEKVQDSSHMDAGLMCNYRVTTGQPPLTIRNVLCPLGPGPVGLGLLWV